MLRISILLVFGIVFIKPAIAQNYRWQQRVDYIMKVRLDVHNHRLTGTQKLKYQNQSNDTITRVYYHLYFNAFQPGSMMDIRSRTIADPDVRIGSRIKDLKEDEIGYLRVIALSQDGDSTIFREIGTILEVELPHPLLPHASTTLEMGFEAQVPLQIRRSGRTNREGIAYSMTQWYPKLAEYDHEGWHIDPYVFREFFGVWGDFEVSITLDQSYTVAGTGVLQNADSVGHGYQSSGPAVRRRKGKDLTWRFVAHNVHDFAWAADPDYKHVSTLVPGGPLVHFFYQENEKTEGWKDLPELAVKLFQFMESHVGRYPYPTYSVIQGGDGGMEYPMCTLILGEGKLPGLAGTMFHEIAHTWFQMILASNESSHAWMDEGFAEFMEYEALSEILGINNKFETLYRKYRRLALSGTEEPMHQFSDFFTTNAAYSMAAYFKGCILLNQLRYIVGDDLFWKGIRAYFETWKFRHPEPADFFRIMERVSGMQLKWYFNYWTATTKQIDYAIRSTRNENGRTTVTLARKGELPMPIELLVEYKDGAKELFYIPLNETFGSRQPDGKYKWTVCSTWYWVNPEYVLVIDRAEADIASLQIDPTGRLADVHPADNHLDITAAP